jgi:predicted 3-demethylubiquinone-9 3-methyltransferase (glyoxalase superfamily)
MTYRSKVRICLWFESRGLEAAVFYVSLLPLNAIDAVYPHGNPDDLMIVEFTLHGAPMMIVGP